MDNGSRSFQSRGGRGCGRERFLIRACEAEDDILDI